LLTLLIRFFSYPENKTSIFL